MLLQVRHDLYPLGIVSSSPLVLSSSHHFLGLSPQSRHTCASPLSAYAAGMSPVTVLVLIKVFLPDHEGRLGVSAQCSVPSDSERTRAWEEPGSFHLQERCS